MKDAIPVFCLQMPGSLFMNLRKKTFGTSFVEVDCEWILGAITTILSLQFEPLIWSEKYLSLYRGMHTEPFHWSISIFACKSWQANIFVKLLCVNMSLYFSWKSSFLKWHLLPFPVKSNFQEGMNSGCNFWEFLSKLILHLLTFFLSNLFRTFKIGAELGQIDFKIGMRSVFNFWSDICCC